MVELVGIDGNGVVMAVVTVMVVKMIVMVVIITCSRYTKQC